MYGRFSSIVHDMMMASRIAVSELNGRPGLNKTDARDFADRQKIFTSGLFNKPFFTGTRRHAAITANVRLGQFPMRPRARGSTQLCRNVVTVIL